MNQLFLVRCLKRVCMESKSVRLKGLTVLLPHILRLCSDVWVNPMISSRNEVLEYLNNVDTLKILSCYCNAYYAQHTIWLNSDTQIKKKNCHTFYAPVLMSESNYKIPRITFFSIASVIQTMYRSKLTHSFLIKAANLSGSVLYWYMYLIMGEQAE